MSAELSNLDREDRSVEKCVRIVLAVSWNQYRIVDADRVVTLKMCVAVVANDDLSVLVERELLCWNARNDPFTVEVCCLDDNANRSRPIGPAIDDGDVEVCLIFGRFKRMDSLGPFTADELDDVIY